MRHIFQILVKFSDAVSEALEESDLSDIQNIDLINRMFTLNHLISLAYWDFRVKGMHSTFMHSLSRSRRKGKRKEYNNHNSKSKIQFCSLKDPMSTNVRLFT